MLIRDGENNLRVLTEADLRRIVFEVVALAMKMQTPLPPKLTGKPELEQYLDRSETAEILGVCPSTIDNMRRDGRLKSYNVRRRVKLKLSEVQAYLDNQK